ncbi:MAG TPA: hypothetical protein DEA08_25570 [Planctomycetes bacterium]|nr:hypothetical protein [Planctomycetota bacterium]
MLSDLKRCGAKHGLHLLKGNHVSMEGSTSLAYPESWARTWFAIGLAPMENKSATGSVAYVFEIWLDPPFAYEEACVLGARIDLPRPMTRDEVYQGWRLIGRRLEESDRSDFSAPFSLSAELVEKSLSAFAGGGVSVVVVGLTELTNEAAVEQKLFDRVLATKAAK